jgi:hypothetical protein
MQKKELNSSGGWSFSNLIFRRNTSNSTSVQKPIGSALTDLDQNDLDVDLDASDSDDFKVSDSLQKKRSIQNKPIPQKSFRCSSCLSGSLSALWTGIKGLGSIIFWVYEISLGKIIDKWCRKDNSLKPSSRNYKPLSLAEDEGSSTYVYNILKSKEQPRSCAIQ